MDAVFSSIPLSPQQYPQVLADDLDVVDCPHLAKLISHEPLAVASVKMAATGWYVQRPRRTSQPCCPAGPRRAVLVRKLVLGVERQEDASYIVRALFR